MRNQQVLALSYKRSNNGRRQEKVSWLLRRSMVDSLEIALNILIMSRRNLARVSGRLAERGWLM
jgi:hypothetical protein